MYEWIKSWEFGLLYSFFADLILKICYNRVSNNKRNNAETRLKLWDLEKINLRS